MQIDCCLVQVFLSKSLASSMRFRIQRGECDLYSSTIATRRDISFPSRQACSENSFKASELLAFNPGSGSGGWLRVWVALIKLEGNWGGPGVWGVL